MARAAQLRMDSCGRGRARRDAGKALGRDAMHLVRSGAGALPQAEWRTPFERRSSMTPMRCSRVAVVPWQVVPIEIGAGRAQVLVVGGDGEAEALQNGEGPPGIPRQ